VQVLLGADRFAWPDAQAAFACADCASHGRWSTDVEKIAFFTPARVGQSLAPSSPVTGTDAMYSGDASAPPLML